MYGIVTDDADLARGNAADVVYYVADHVHGHRQDPLDGVVNSVACWGDTQRVREDPGRAAVTADGTRATPDAAGHHWGTVCPTDTDYRDAVLERIQRVGAVGDVRLTTAGFPGPSYCHCERCEDRFTASGRDDRDAWRSDVMTTFVSEAAARVEGDLWVTLTPDPYPGNLRERRGLTPEALAPHADGFFVPMCSVDYATSYWVEVLARGFAREVGGLDVPLAIQLSSGDADADRLFHLAREIEPHADVVVFGTSRCDDVVVRTVVERLRETDAPVPSA